MSLVLVRIDDRFIHGQVVVGWVRALECQQIVVANDRVAQDDLQKDLMSMAVPEVETFFLPLKEAAAQIMQGRFEKKRAILLIESPQDALSLVEAGVKLTAINVGPMKFEPGKEEILPSTSVSEEDKFAFKKLGQKGTKITARLVPSDSGIDFLSRLE